MKQQTNRRALHDACTMLILSATLCITTLNASASLSGTYTINPSSAASASNYLTITSALSDMISGTRGDGGTPNGSGVTGAVIFEFSSSYTSGSETFPLTFGAVSGASSSNTITFRPASGVGSALSITGSNATAIININAGDYYIVDGRPGGTGTSKYIDISNSTAAPVLQYINDATNNIFRYCLIHSDAPANYGTVYFTNTSQTTGNDDNTIDNCNIYGNTTNNGIYSGGTPSKTNSGNTISNCNIYDYFTSGSNSSGIILASNNDAWTIDGNSFYQTATRTTTSNAGHFGIWVNTGSTGGDIVITNNYIGGSTASAGGSAYTFGSTSFSSTFYGIYIWATAGTATSIQGNTIRNLALSTSNSAHTGAGLSTAIFANGGNVDIGTTTGNTIGDNSTGSITMTSSADGGAMNMITATSGTVNIYNNSIGSVTTNGTSTGASVGVRGIWLEGSTGTFTVSGNTIGHASTANSINASNAATGAQGQRVQGIGASMNNNANGLRIINNTISNINNNYAGTSSNGQLLGIFTYQVKDTITGNTISNLSSASGLSGAVFGIGYYLNSIDNNYIANNTIHSLSCTYTGSSTVTVFGIGQQGGTPGITLFERNFIHSLSAASTGTTTLYGISSAGTSTIRNNMVRLGIDESGASITSGYFFYGIYESVAGNLYHNSVYVGGTGVVGSAITAAYYTLVNSGTREILNNIFVNNRSNGAGSGSHYAFRFGSTLGTLTMNNNIFYASGTGGIMGRQSGNNYSTLSAWQTAHSQDANSIYEDPLYNNATGNASAVNLHLLTNSPAESAGTTVASVTEDYDGQTRSGLTPIDIGADAGDFANIWNGTTWSSGAPSSTSNVIINSGTAPATFSCKDLTITSGNTLNTGTGNTVTIYGNYINNGNGVTGTGTITFAKTGSAEIKGDSLETEGSVTVSSGCTLVTNNKLKLLSNATNTGRIGNSAGTISGNVYAQRYNINRRTYRLYGHPFSSSIALSQLVEEVDITGSGGASNGFTTTQTNAPSAYWFDPAAADTSTASVNSGWTAFTSASSADWDRHELLLLYLRGAKGEGLNGGAYTPSASTFEGVGAVNQGDQVITLTKGTNTNFAAVGNPFPSGIQMNTVTLGSNVGSSYYAWDASSGASGAYVTNSWATSYVLPAYAGFFTTISATTSIAVKESDKASGGAALSKGTAQNNWVELLVYDSTIKWDRLLIHFDDNAMAVQDHPDAKKLYNPDLDFYTVSQDDVRLAIDTRPYNDSASIPLGINAYTRYNRYVIKTGDYDIPAGTKLYLHDKYLNKQEEMKQGFEYWFDITADSNSQGNKRFEINMVGKPSNSIANVNDKQAQMQLIPNPAYNEVKVSFDKIDGTAQIYLLDVTGKSLYSTSVAANGSGSIVIDLGRIPSGVYIIQLQSRNAHFSQKLIKE